MEREAIDFGAQLAGEESDRASTTRADTQDGSGAASPLVVYALVPMPVGIPGVAGTSLVFLAALGGGGARVGGAPATRAAARVTFWGALAMALTAGIGALFGNVV